VLAQRIPGSELDICLCPNPACASGTMRIRKSGGGGGGGGGNKPASFMISCTTQGCKAVWWVPKMFKSGEHSRAKQGMQLCSCFVFLFYYFQSLLQSCMFLFLLVVVSLVFLIVCASLYLCYFCAYVLD
jgi:hypothetical protein